MLSAKQLPKAKIPGKYFGIVRCFHYDQVDTHICHPTLGWFELGGSGIFRPEVTASLGARHRPHGAHGPLTRPEYSGDTIYTMESGVTVNPNCACPNKKCPATGKCDECRVTHKKPYCESGAVQQAFARFGFKLYDATIGRKNK